MKLLDSGMLKGRVKSKVLGKVTLTVQNGEQIIRNASTTAAPSYTIGLIDQRLRWANESALYANLKTAIAEGIQNRVPGKSDFNYFLQNNQSVLTIPFGITKQQRKGGAAIVFPAVVTAGDGSLRPVVAQGVNDNHLISNILIGDLAITDTTTIAEFSQAVVDNNGGYEYGDQLTYIQCSQSATNKGPHVRCNYVAVTLSETETTPLGQVSMIGFHSESGCIASGNFVGAACWVHSRLTKGESSVNLVSDQNLVMVGMDAFHRSYRSPMMLRRAAVSYGWIEAPEIVLRSDDLRAVTLAQRYAIPYRFMKSDLTVESLADFLNVTLGDEDYNFSDPGPKIDTSRFTTMTILGDFSQLGELTAVKLNDVACTNPKLEGNKLTVTLPAGVNGQELRSIVVSSATAQATATFSGV